MNTPKNWLLLRGLAREQRHWGDFPQQMEEALGDVKVHCLDLAGTGDQWHRRSPVSIDGITKDLRSRWDRLRRDIDGPWGILAVSLGGMVAMHWCATFPSDFSAAVIMNSSTRDAGGPFERLQTSAIPELLRAMREKDNTRREKIILRFTSTRTEGLDEVARRNAALLTEAPMRRSTAVSQITAATRFKTPERIEVPLLFLASWGDNMVSPNCSLRLAEYFQAPLMVHPTAGHELGLDAPQWVIESVHYWVRSSLYPLSEDSLEKAPRKAS